MIYDDVDLRKLAVRVNSGETFTGKIFKMANVDSRIAISNETTYAWDPIGNSEENYFDGTLYGEWNTIQYSCESLENYAGLFGHTGENSYIEYLNIESSWVSGYGDAGALVGCNKGVLYRLYSRELIRGE